MLRDLRLAVRMLRKQPGFTLIVAITLALGIGATSAIFNLIQGVLLTPPPYRQPEKLVLIYPNTPDAKAAGPRGWAAMQWLEWQKQARSFDAIAAYGWNFNFLIRGDGSESMEGMRVTPEYFRAVGLAPILGRTFLESEAKPGAPPDVIILGYNFWQRKFNGDPRIVGSTIRMSRRKTPVTVIGVMPPGVRFLPAPEVAKEPNYDPDAQVDFWEPEAPDPKG